MQSNNNEIIHIKNRAWSPSLPSPSLHHVFTSVKSKMAAKKKMQGVVGAAAGGGIGGAPYKKYGGKKKNIYLCKG